MEPKGKAYKPSAIRQLPVNTDDYLKTAQEKIPIDELFFHKYVQSIIPFVILGGEKL